MEIKKIGKRLLLLFGIIINSFFIKDNTYAAIAVNGGTPWVNISATNAFDYCLEMKNVETSTLGQNQLDPHLVTSSDWGICAYLGASPYGSVRSRDGSSITLSAVNGPDTLTSEKNFYTTTGNATGVMDLGANPYASNSSYYWHTYTASLLSEDKDGNGILEYAGTSNYATLSSLIEYRNKNSKYVEALSIEANNETTKGQTYTETAGWYGSSAGYPTITYPLGVRHKGIFGYWHNVR